MKVALVHDQIGEFGGAERVLLALSEIWPDAPIYTSYARSGPFLEKLKGKKIVTSWADSIPSFSSFLYSPLRFLAPFIWNSFVRQLADYDVVISSASWYITKGFGARGTSRKSPIEICYCHTPPRYLYGYETAMHKNLLVQLYGFVVNKFMRMYDFNAAQKVDYFIANSENVKTRIQKYYKRDAVVIYPPVELAGRVRGKGKRDYYLVVARIVGAKGLEMAVEVANSMKIRLKIVGSPAGFSRVYQDLMKKAGDTIEFLGYVSDSELAELYAGAKAFLALARDEDFGITPVEALQAGTPVIAYRGGGYLETVVDGKTGIFFEGYSTEGLAGAIKRFEKMKFNPQECIEQGKEFSKKKFQGNIKKFVEEKQHGSNR